MGRRDTLPSPTPSRRGALLLFLLLNALWQILQMDGLCRATVPGLGGPDRALFAAFCGSCFTAVALLLYAGCLLLSRRAPPRLLPLFVTTLSTWFLFFDNKFYKLQHVHLYGALVLQTLHNAEVNQTIHFDLSAVLGLVAVLAVVALAEVVLLMGLTSLWARLAEQRRLRLERALCLLAVACTVAGAGATALLKRRLFDLTSPVAGLLPVDRVFSSGGRKTETLAAIGPVFPPLPAMKRRPDMLVIAVESLRADVLNPDVMPNVDRFAREQGCLRPLRTYSGSHVTERGVFAILYGLHSYNFAALSQVGTRSFPLEVLRHNGYVLAGASGNNLSQWNHAGFIVKQFSPYGEFPRERSFQRDTDMLAWELYHIEDIGDHSPRPPSFDFLFFDSTHVDYSYPPEFEKFKPVLNDKWIAYLRSSQMGDHKQEIINRYKNSTLYVDHMIGAILQAKRREIAAGNLVVAITGDHGEEFWEHGYFGHGSTSFENERTKVPLVLCLPGVTAPQADLASHVDIFPTILDYAGVPPEVTATATSGTSLLRPPPAGHYLVVSGAHFPLDEPEVALITPQRKYWLHQDEEWRDHFVVLRTTDLDDHPVPPGGPPPQPYIEAFNRGFARFLRY